MIKEVLWITLFLLIMFPVIVITGLLLKLAVLGG